MLLLASLREGGGTASRMLCLVIPYQAELKAVKGTPVPRITSHCWGTINLVLVSSPPAGQTVRSVTPSKTFPSKTDLAETPSPPVSQQATKQQAAEEPLTRHQLSFLHCTLRHWLVVVGSSPPTFKKAVSDIGHQQFLHAHSTPYRSADTSTD